MIKVGEQLKYDLMGTPHDGGIVVHTSQVAHVAFYITKHPEIEGWYKLFEESEKRGICEYTGEGHISGNFYSYEEATYWLAQAQAHLESILEYKRKGSPTPKQLHFLFRNKIPIPVDLTWGQASDLIDEKMIQLDREKQAYFQGKAEKYSGFIVGMRVAYGKKLKGEITKLTSSNDGHHRYAWIKFDGEEYESRVWIREAGGLQKIDESAGEA